MKKFVLKLDLQDERDKRRALKTVSTLSGIDEITVDMKGKKLTVIGNVDPVTVVTKLRKKNWPTDIISVGPATEPEKKEEAKEEAKEEEPIKEEEKKKDEAELVVAMPYRQYYPSMNKNYYVHHSVEENPNACLIC